jgi:predicted SprT family Zn-dependent metalloprotease
MIELLLEPGSTALPSCDCGHEMNLVRQERKSGDTHTNVYACTPCRRELHLMIWNEIG